MTELLNQAFLAAAKLSQDEQDALARELLARLEADARWGALFADPRSEAFLAKLADEVRGDVARGDVLDYDPANRPK
ncbi:MAG: hypothetical protein ACKVP7_14795 [Hyphomicrobiaceae bacterium]